VVERDARALSDLNRTHARPRPNSATAPLVLAVAVFLRQTLGVRLANRRSCSSKTKMIHLDTAVAQWRNAGPLSEQSLQFLLELREAALPDQPQELLWAQFVRSLSVDQR
jgi:hypothetical protein